ncbi:MAG: D-alanine--D-alanine ligase [Aquificae bacterium]|nr:D-alanine--D-alanine ligase [Aquificota bacterium]
MNKNLKIALLYGGASSEREISIKSGKAVENSLKRLGIPYKVFDPIDKKRFIDKIVQYQPDLAFIALHGKGGEDGTIQSLLEFLNIKYTGSDPKASAITIDKSITKSILSAYKIPVPSGITLTSSQREIPKIEFPAVVKPATEGSSVGVFIVRNRQELEKAVKEAYKLDSKIVIEKYIEGREITVGILNEEPLEIVEILVEEGFYDYKNKYLSTKTKYICPAEIEKNTYQLIKAIAKRSCELLGVKGTARVDFILDKNDTPYLLEINTIPGMTDHSLLPKSALASGLDFDTLIENIIMGALYGKEKKKT